MSSAISILGRRISVGDGTWIIAEIGINHGGDEGVCAEMIDAAAAAGADAVKLQTVTPDVSYHPDTESYRLFKDSVLSERSLIRLAERARGKGVVLFSTPGDHAALALMQQIGMPAIKISSGLLTNLPLIVSAAATGLPLIMSTGMAFEAEIRAAVAAARRGGACGIALMQCTSLYPAPGESLNLLAMDSLRREFGVPVGYSDHHNGDLACVAAVAMGASIIEKHFTLDRTVAGADHAISLEPAEFAAMVSAIRTVERMRGSAAKEPDAAEVPLREGRHRRLVAARDLDAGHLLSGADLHLMRLPADLLAMPASRLEEVIGKRMLRPVARLSGVTADMVEDVR